MSTEGRGEAGSLAEGWGLAAESGAEVGIGVYFAACRVGDWKRVVRVMVVR